MADEGIRELWRALAASPGDEDILERYEAELRRCGLMEVAPPARKKRSFPFGFALLGLSLLSGLGGCVYQRESKYGALRPLAERVTYYVENRSEKPEYHPPKGSLAERLGFGFPRAKGKHELLCQYAQEGEFRVYHRLRMRGVAVNEDGYRGKKVMAMILDEDQDGFFDVEEIEKYVCREDLLDHLRFYGVVDEDTDLSVLGPPTCSCCRD